MWSVLHLEPERQTYFFLIAQELVTGFPSALIQASQLGKSREKCNGLGTEAITFPLAQSSFELLLLGLPDEQTRPLSFQPLTQQTHPGSCLSQTNQPKVPWPSGASVPTGERNKSTHLESERGREGKKHQRVTMTGRLR